MKPRCFVMFRARYLEPVYVEGQSVSFSQNSSVDCSYVSSTWLSMCPCSPQSWLSATVCDYSLVLIKFHQKTGFIGESDGSSFAVFTDVDATQAGSFANLCAGDATKIREVLYSLLVGGRSMFSLDPYIIAQILFMVVSIRRRLMIILIVWRLVDKSIKVINKSNEAIEPRYQPILPTTEKYKSSPSVSSKTHAPRKMICCSLTCIISIFCNTVFIPRSSLSTLYLYLSPRSRMYADKFEWKWFPQEKWKR